MKFLFLSLLGIFILSNPTPTTAQSIYPCPPAGQSTPIPSWETTPTLPLISNPNGVCTLLRRSTDGPSAGANRAYVARSYAGREWEKSPGLFAENDAVSIDCASGGSSNECSVTLPPSEEGEEYVLESWEYETSVEGEAARFLEQATFGATAQDIHHLTSTSNSFTLYLQHQIYTTPPSSHRQFYRSHTNPKLEYSYTVGAVGALPCEQYSRWRRYALTSRDQLSNRKTFWYKHLVVSYNSSSGRYVWKVDGHFRTTTPNKPVIIDGGSFPLNTRVRLEWKSQESWQSDCVGCPVPTSQGTIENPPVSLEGAESKDDMLPYGTVSLPPFQSTELPTIETAEEYPLFDTWIKPYENALLNTTTLSTSNQCNDHPNFHQPLPLTGTDSPPGTFPTVFGRSTDNTVFAYDPHFSFQENTIDNPLMDGGGQMALDTQDLVAGTPALCQNVERNFLNENGCQLSYHESACGVAEKPKKVMVLSESNLGGMRELTNRVVYPVSGLTLGEAASGGFVGSPCGAGSQESRWVKDDSDSACTNTAGLAPKTMDLFRYLIGSVKQRGKDYNSNVVDVERSIRTCDDNDSSKTDLGKVKAGDGSCWRHAHPSNLSVIDLTAAFSGNYVISGDTVSMSTATFHQVIDSDKSKYPVLGRLGDHVLLDDAEPALLKDSSIADSYTSYDYNPSGGPVLVCGSRNEVASDPFYGDHGFDVTMAEGTGYRSFSNWELSAQRHTTWTHLALHAADQLRQKMAWSLSQIVAVGLPGSGAVFNEETEHYINFYDMFVTHAFGSYLDLMKEFSFNVIMGSWLSFTENRSLQSNIDDGLGLNYPDENYAREIMQLFSIGLYQLNMDGSKVLQDGKPVQTYDIDDIVSYSRAWTGFENPKDRGGVSTGERQWSDKPIDPMGIEDKIRDLFPKTDLIGGFIGDRLPLCVDLPAKHFLRKGATFKALGDKPVPQHQADSGDWSENPDLLQLEIEPSSPLYAKLCAPDATGECTLPSKVVLDENLIYDDVAKMGAEYAVDTIRTVLLNIGLPSPLYYEYYRQPCVEHSFYSGAKKVSKGQIFSNSVMEPTMCANPNLEVATPMCTDATFETKSSWGKIYCNYQGERVTYASAEAICEANGKVQGHPWVVKEIKGGPCANGVSNRHFRSWSNASCNVKVKVSFESGDIAIVHEPQPDNAGFLTVETLVDQNTANFFKASWSGATSPSLNDCLALPSCYAHSDGSCICSTEIAENPVYSSAGEISSIDDLMASLPAGAADPAMFDVGTYTDIGSCNIPDVTVFSTNGDCSSFSSNNIFVFEWKSKQYFLKNAKSTVSIAGSSFSFRNPVQFNSLADPEERDMHYETDEVLNSLYYHPSHPPFLAMRLIQRFGVSNPSPSFIERVAIAYSTGTYGQFGSGKYGDLGAMAAAILLDDETRQVALDADPTHGHVREPLVKVLSLHRSMGISYASPLHVPTLLQTEGKIGQGYWESPSVFSFFLPEFTPSVSEVRSAQLVAPESMVLQSNNILNLMESMHGAIKFGITDCYSPSFENWRVRSPFDCASEEGDTSLSVARPTYWPSSTDTVDDILDELAILLTSGRLGDNNRALIKSIVEQEFSNGSVAKSIRMAQELILTTPEFHATSVARKQQTLREISGYETMPPAPYKAVVVLMMIGGADSFNLLVPIGDCEKGDQYEEYKEARGGKAKPVADLISIYDTDSNQNCAHFGVNNEFDLLADLYNNNEAVFFANTGVLSKHTSKNDSWGDDQSFQLFAHNTMQAEYYKGDPYEANAGTGVFGRILDVLKLKGQNTSPNSVGAGGKMLEGDQQYNNHIYSVSTSPPSALNMNPTIANLYDVVKELNGVGDAGNGVMSETWSSRVTSALFENEEMQKIASMPEFEISNYDSGSDLGSRFRAVAEYMRSREYRKVNREVYIVQQTGYDGHDGNNADGLFSSANGALVKFIETLKDEGLWESTVIMMGSDFGRSLNPNSNGGTDHAWGGNYFIAGGSVKGGRILGKYPQPLSPENDKWIGRGRFIPTTPWDAVWNGVANWLGVQDEADLDYALPNRGSFNKCDLLFDKDLFTDGACTCTGCVRVTFPPTQPLTPKPTVGPTLNPTAKPTNAVTPVPTANLSTASPTNIPTPPPVSTPTQHVSGEYVSTIFSTDSTVTNVGCTSSNDGVNKRSFDKTTEKFYCTRNGLEPPGIIVSPSHEQMSIAKKLRVYAHNNCPHCDVVTYIVSGRADASSEWVEVSSGDLPWVNEALGRNDRGQNIVSTYENADPKLAVTEVDLSSNNAAFLEYKVAFPDVRNGGEPQWSEVELPGILLTGTQAPATPVTPAPSKAPSKSPTKVPTSEPTPAPSKAPVTPVPTTRPTNAATPVRTANPTTATPTKNPTPQPVTPAPTNNPTTASPTKNPTPQPVTPAPTNNPTTASPTKNPTPRPVTPAPTKNPTPQPVTPAPTVRPTVNPTMASPTKNPTPSPTKSPTKIPTSPPVSSPTSPVMGENVNTIFSTDSTVTNVGCTSSNDGRNKKSFDKTTEKFYCTRNGLEPPGIIVTPGHEQMSIAKKLRVYSHNNCPNCDVVTYIVSGRVDASSEWVEVSSGDLPWVNEALGRNDRGQNIVSTYENADPKLAVTEVDLTSNNAAFLEYKVVFPDVRNNGEPQWAEVELPGFLIAPDPTMTPTSAPSSSDPENGERVATILTKGSAMTNFGCSNSPNTRAIDLTTEKYICYTTGGPNGLIITPLHGKMSIAKSFRLYPHNNSAKSDAISYIVEGRVNASSEWVVIGEGDLPWVSTTRNPRGMSVSSTFESGDTNLNFVEVPFPSNSTPFLEYKVTFTATREANYEYCQLAEIELPGYILG